MTCSTAFAKPSSSLDVVMCRAGWPRRAGDGRRPQVGAEQRASGLVGALTGNLSRLPTTARPGLCPQMVEQAAIKASASPFDGAFLAAVVRRVRSICFTSRMAWSKSLSTGTASAARPAAQRSYSSSALERHNGGEPYFDAITDLHIDLLALAMSCDITRFGTLVMNDLSYAGNPLGLPEDNHGAMAHTYSAAALGSSGHPVGPGDPATWRLLARFNRYAYRKVARLLQRLTEYGIVDSTLVYASSDMGNPATHSTRNVPTVLAGGLNGKIRMGRRIQYRTDCPLGTLCDPKGGDYQTVPNNQLLVSIAQAFGVDLVSYGIQAEAQYAGGTLPGL